MIPWIINIELTNACNLECIFCDHKELKKKMQIKGMAHTLLRKVLEDAAAVSNGGKLHELGLVGLGEPTLDPNLKEHLALIGEYCEIFERISFNSNLVSLNSELAQILVDSKINAYTFSVNAHNRERYLELMGKDYFDRVIKNLNLLLRLLRQRPDFPSVGIQIFKYAPGDKEGLKALIDESVRAGVKFFYRSVCYKPAMRIGRSILNTYKPEKSRRYPCWDIYTRVYIDVDGNLYPCTIGNDSYRSSSNLYLGNITERSIMELFNSERACEARRIYEQGGIPFSECKTCNVWALTPNNFFWNERLKKWEIRKQQVRAYSLKVKT